MKNTLDNCLPLATNQFLVAKGYIVATAGLLYLATAPGHTTGVNQFIESWLAELSISRSLLAAIWTGASISSAFLVPFFGSVLDHWGSRRSLTIVAVLYVGSLVGLSFADSALTLAIGLAALRFFGPECLMLTASFTINKWWSKQRGRVNFVCDSKKDQ